MNHNKWKYSQTAPIKSYDDIERELERAELHQKFLTEIIGNDKELMKQALSFPNMIQSGLIALTGKGEDSPIHGVFDNNMILSIAKWIFNKLF